MLTAHEIEDILDRFRAWLHEANEELDHPEILALAERFSSQPCTAGEKGPGGETPSAGILQMAEAFTALRHEIKLQTKGLRGQQEHLQSNQQTLEAAIDELRNNRRDTLKVADESAAAAARPLLVGLLDIDEAIGQAIRSAERLLTAANPAEASPADRTQRSLVDELDQDFHSLPAWKRILFRNYWQHIRQRLAEIPAPTRPASLETTLEGLRMLQTRLQRVLSAAEVQSTPCVGQRVEPRTMRVVEVIDDPTQPPETVIDEIRAGYQWKGTILRPAEVRATKSQATTTSNNH